MSLSEHCCECYKKLKSIGVPLYIEQEKNDYGEDAKEISYNSVFRLPGIMTVDESVEEYPIVQENELFHVFQQMVRIVNNLEDYETNVLSFWILDMFIEGLQTAQNARMQHSHQRVTLEWIAYFFNYLQLYDISRTDMFNHLKDLLFSNSALFREKEENTSMTSEDDTQETMQSGPNDSLWNLPRPPVITEEGEVKLADYFSKYGSARAMNDEEYSLNDIYKDENDSEINVEHFNIILEILYRIFGRFWVFQEIRTVFHSMPFAEMVDLPFEIQTPKPVLKPDSPYYNKFSKQTNYESDDEIHLDKNEFILPLQFSEAAMLYVDDISSVMSSQTMALSDSVVQGKRKSTMNK